MCFVVKELGMFDKAAGSGEKRKPRQMPSSFTILFGCLLLVAIVSWVVSSFSPDVQAATLGNFMASPFLGFESAMQVCVFILGRRPKNGRTRHRYRRARPQTGRQ